MDFSIPDKLMERDIWRRLAAHRTVMGRCHMREFFETDPDRAMRFSEESPHLFVDYSKHRITDETLLLLFELAESAKLQEAIENLFNGKHLNVTEDRAALHTALRRFDNAPLVVDGQDIRQSVKNMRHQIKTFTHAVIEQEWLGFTGKPITDIVNIGIGGSCLGPKMVCHALKPYANTGLRVHFLSHLDASQFESVVSGLKADTTIFILSTKSGKTQETMMNARSARAWFLNQGGYLSAMAQHFVAVTNDCEHFTTFGIPPENCFEIWDWVGGRYSLWGATGLPIALSIGYDNYIRLLKGAENMDHHFRQQPFSKNLPVIMAMLGIWYINFYDARSHLIAPYDHLLRDLPNHLQQLEMESNAKQVSLEGYQIPYPTVPVIWGESGLEGQHAYFQVLHQGSPLIPVDFIASLSNHSPNVAHQQLLLANCFAQSEAMMIGRTADESRMMLRHRGLSDDEIEKTLVHHIFEGNRPSTTLLLDIVDPETLGALIALYEHKVFVQSVIWQVNPFDQMGVELGKPLAEQIASELRQGKILAHHDTSTIQLISRYLMENPITYPIKAVEQS